MSGYDQQFSYGFEDYQQNLGMQQIISNFQVSNFNLEFQNFGSPSNFESPPDYYSPNPTQQYQPNIFTPNFDQPNKCEEDEEPPLLEVSLWD